MSNLGIAQAVGTRNELIDMVAELPYIANRLGYLPEVVAAAKRTLLQDLVDCDYYWATSGVRALLDATERSIAA